METSTHDATGVLRNEILADAQKEAEEVVRGAQEQAGQFADKANAEAAKARKERLEQARAEAERRTASIMATIAVEANRLRLARIETLLASVREEIHRQLRTRDHRDYQEAITQLAIEAISRMTGEAFVVRLSRTDTLEFGAALPQRIISRLQGRSLSITISPDETIIGGGVIIHDTEGRQLWDNRFSARLERLWPELRRQIAQQSGLLTSAASQGTAS